MTYDDCNSLKFCVSRPQIQTSDSLYCNILHKNLERDSLKFETSVNNWRSDQVSYGKKGCDLVWDQSMI